MEGTTPTVDATSPLGELSVLNVGAGDIVVSFNKHDKGETAKALKMLADMQRLGYAILVQLEDGEYARAVEIDATRGRYIIQLPDGEPEQAGPDVEPVDGTAAATEICGVVGSTDEFSKLVCVKPRFPAHAGHHVDVDGVEFSAKRGAKREGVKAKRSRVAKPIRTSKAVGVARSAGG